MLGSLLRDLFWKPFLNFAYMFSFCTILEKFWVVLQVNSGLIRSLGLYKLGHLTHNLMSFDCRWHSRWWNANL
jgi:hypothetical protein